MTAAWFFLSRQQNAEGTFPTQTNAQPGITSLTVIAFSARGHQPGKGPYGDRLERAVDWILSRQNPRSGVIVPDGFDVNETTNYCHGISGVMLAEVYGMIGGCTGNGVFARRSSRLLLILREVSKSFRNTSPRRGGVGVISHTGLTATRRISRQRRGN